MDKCRKDKEQRNGWPSQLRVITFKVDISTKFQVFLVENLVPILVLVLEKLFHEIIAKELVEYPHVAYKVIN